MTIEWATFFFVFLVLIAIVWTLGQVLFIQGLLKHVLTILHNVVDNSNKECNQKDNKKKFS
jgi:hypothetical protein